MSDTPEVHPEPGESSVTEPAAAETTTDAIPVVSPQAAAEMPYEPGKTTIVGPPDTEGAPISGIPTTPAEDTPPPASD